MMVVEAEEQVGLFINACQQFWTTISSCTIGGGGGRWTTTGWNLGYQDLIHHFSITATGGGGGLRCAAINNPWGALTGGPGGGGGGGNRDSGTPGLGGTGNTPAVPAPLGGPQGEPGGSGAGNPNQGGGGGGGGPSGATGANSSGWTWSNRRRRSWRIGNRFITNIWSTQPYYPALTTGPNSTRAGGGGGGGAGSQGAGGAGGGGAGGPVGAVPETVKLVEVVVEVEDHPGLEWS
jgi:hypothetical protein